MDPSPWLVDVFLGGGFCNSFPCLILQGRINRNVAGKSTGGVGPRLWRCQVQLPPVFEICVRKLRVGRVHCMSQVGHAAVHWDHVKHPPKRLNSWQVGSCWLCNLAKTSDLLGFPSENSLNVRHISRVFGWSASFGSSWPTKPGEPSADASEVGMWSQIGVVWTSQINTWESPVDLKNGGSSGFMTLISWD